MSATTAGTNPITSLDLQKRVKSALALVAKDLGSVAVDVTGHQTVHLSGSVRSFYLRQLAVATAKRVAGVRHVSDGMHVLRGKPAAGNAN